MNFIEKLEQAWSSSNSLLCVGLDPNWQKIPEHLKTLPEPIFEFCKSIVDATHDLVCAYKPQIAYFSGLQAEDQLEKTLNYVRETYPHIPIILDSKRGDASMISQTWNSNNNCCLVIGATWPQQMATLREIAGDIPFLVPGVGAQGGDVESLVKAGQTAEGRGLIINSSRAVIYAGSDQNFAIASRKVALETRELINQYRNS